MSVHKILVVKMQYVQIQSVVLVAVVNKTILVIHTEVVWTLMNALK